MPQKELILRETYCTHPHFGAILEAVTHQKRISLKGLCGSSSALLAASVVQVLGGIHLVILSDATQAAFFYNDLTNILNEEEVLLLPPSFRRSAAQIRTDEGQLILRTRVLGLLHQEKVQKAIIIASAESLAEKVLSGSHMDQNTLRLKKGERVTIGFIRDILNEYQFTSSDFVFEPGQYSVRGSIVDIFSYAHHLPFRIDFFGKEVESIRSFDIDSQLSSEFFDEITIIPNIRKFLTSESSVCFLKLLPKETLIWSEDLPLSIDSIDKLYKSPVRRYLREDGETVGIPATELFIPARTFEEMLPSFRHIEFGHFAGYEGHKLFEFHTEPQPTFNKNFELMAENLAMSSERGYQCCLLSENPKQFDRLRNIFLGTRIHALFTSVPNIIHEGFIDHDLQKCFYTDHQAFERYHKYRIRKGFSRSESFTMRDLQGLHPGDYVVHIDHGVGIFGGLEKIMNNTREQECIRLVYRDNDVLYVNIHNLHKISKYRGKDREAPKMNKLGTPAWQTLKQTAKKRVKDIARDLILIYAKRHANKGFAFSPDSFLQEELEASFIFEDTPDQLKATQNVKAAMENDIPMDHLVCGDVGFGKTEIAIRAAFKAVTDNKQVAVLVPTTILAMQHERTFAERLEKFPVRTEHLSRLTGYKETKEILLDLKSGKVDILIGTHKILGKGVEFKDLGLLIIDEEQKFGVGAKEKLKTLRAEVDTLTLTATPIPRTLQFSLVGIRDMSVIATPPPNRYPIHTEVSPFDHNLIREAIELEVSRGGQVFVINNRVQHLTEMEALIRKICPHVTTVCAHGQMHGDQLEKIMMDFVSGDYDVLVATSIIESGLDIPNANTIIINNAHHFGLSDLHQMRGRVGRTNKKAFCYLMAPPLNDLTPEARRRLQAIEEFSELGSGFNIAMQDLDIRGAGNMMGAEQSGFIADIGFETYHRILNEAMQELREESDIREILGNQEDSPTSEFRIQMTVAECQIDTDLELLIPATYIENVSERIRLYRELDTLESEEKLKAFEASLADRFGPVPDETTELIHTVRLRWMAGELGLEKMVLRNERLLAYFISNPQAPFYQSARFMNMLRYIQQKPRLFSLKEARDKLAMSISPVKNIRFAMELFREMLEST